MVNKNISPTIEQSLKMIEEKLENQKKNKKENKNTNLLKKKVSKYPTLSNLFKKNKENKKDNVLLLTKKVDDKGKIIKLKENKILQKKVKVNSESIIEKEEEKINLNIKDHKNLSKTTDLAVIIKKLKNIRDKKLNNKKNSKKINKEIKKLNETVDLAEELFKKELLDL